MSNNIQAQIRTNSFWNHYTDVRAAINSNAAVLLPTDIGGYTEFMVQLPKQVALEIVDSVEDFQSDNVDFGEKPDDALLLGEVVDGDFVFRYTG